MADLVTAKKWLKNANTVIVTAGNGMAKEEELDILSEEGFDDQFGKIADKYDVHTIGDALDKRFDTWSEQWAFWSGLINEYSLQYEPSEVMQYRQPIAEGYNKIQVKAYSTEGTVGEYEGEYTYTPQNTQ